MNKKIRIVIITAVVIIALTLLNFSGAFSFLNKYIHGTPNKYCSADSDCVLKDTTCGFCDCGDAVNKDWNVFCPFRNPPMQVMCKMCPSPNYDFEVKCIENQCQRAWKNR